MTTAITHPDDARRHAGAVDKADPDPEVPERSRGPRRYPALHRLRHGVATHLVNQGKLLKAQARLGHRDPSTTLRHYSHATMLDDLDVADELDALLGGG